MEREALRRRGRHSSSDDKDSRKGGYPVRTIVIVLLAIFLICSFQLVLLSSRSEILPQGGDTLLLKQNLTALAQLQSVLEQRVRSQTDTIAAIQANVQHEHSSVEQVKDQISGQLTNMQAMKQDPERFAAVQAQQNQELRQSQERQRQEIEELKRSVDAMRNQMEDLRAAQTAQQRSMSLLGSSMASRDLPPQGYSGEASPYDSIVFPASWLTRNTKEDLIASAKEADKWLQMTKSAFKHAWKGYKERAWGQDEFRPVTGSPGRRWANCGLQILDALSTMWVMGMRQEFDEAEKWVDQSLRFDSPGLVSVFEVTIRALGGLASAHALSGREVFLRRARELADRLLPAFADDTGFPSTQIDLKSGQRKHGWYQGTVLAEAGTLQLEFRYISQQTGDPKYAEKADRSMRSVIAAANGRGLVPWGLSKAGPPRAQNAHVTLGAMGDSYYEYLLKVWLQTSKSEPTWKDEWKKAMQEMQQRLIMRTQGGLTYVAEENNGRTTHKMDHLACFVGGMLVYGARTLPEAEVDQVWEKTAAEITETCYQMYYREPSHLAPECVALRPEAGGVEDMTVWNNAAHYLLRPEAAEAIFYMHYYTGDPKYRKMAGLIIEAIEAHTKTQFGYSAVADVRQEQPRQKNEMETFFIAETLKYLYLTFVPNPRSVIDLDEFVFTTEAHPLRIFRPTGNKGFLSRGSGGSQYYPSFR